MRCRQTPVSDKNLHFMAFFGLSFLLAWSWTTRRPFLPAGALFAVLVAVVYGAFDEITQAFIPGRFADVADWYYDAAGTIAGIGGLRRGQRGFPTSRPPPDVASQ